MKVLNNYKSSLNYIFIDLETYGDLLAKRIIGF